MYLYRVLCSIVFGGNKTMCGLYSMIIPLWRIWYQGRLCSFACYWYMFLQLFIKYMWNLLIESAVMFKPVFKAQSLWYWICSFLLSIHYQLSASAQTQTRDNVIDKLAEEIRSIKVRTPYDIFLIHFFEFPGDGYLHILVQIVCYHLYQHSEKWTMQVCKYM